jgi:hypothetical protein
VDLRALAAAQLGKETVKLEDRRRLPGSDIERDVVHRGWMPPDHEQVPDRGSLRRSAWTARGLARGLDCGARALAVDPAEESNTNPRLSAFPRMICNRVSVPMTFTEAS